MQSHLLVIFPVQYVYFLKTNKDTVSATKKFIADTAAPWKVKILKIW